MSENYKRKRRRRLKPSVKRFLLLTLLVIIIVALRPWRLIGSASGESQSAESDSVRMSLNMLVQNSDSDIPEAIKFDKAVVNFMRQWEIVGASIAIMKDGNLIYSKGYGYVNLKDSVKTEVQHIFRVASVSKLITSVAIMKLCERGVLSLNSTIFGERGILSEYTGYSDKKFEKMTIEDLLRHQGGLSVRAGDPMFDAAKMGLKLPVTSTSMIEYVLRSGLRYTPGSRTMYSNVGYMILSEVISKITRMPYETYVKDSILAPIGCYDMHIGHNTSAQAHSNESRYYEATQDELIPAADGSGRMVRKSDGGNNIELLAGAGGWVASPVELLRFAASIDTRSSHATIISAASIDKMTRFDKSRLPLGWIGVNEKGDWWRSGTMAGTSAMLRRQNNGYTWVFVTNTSSWKGSRFAPMINSMLQRAFGKVTEWPDKDLFKIDSIQ